MKIEVGKSYIDKDGGKATVDFHARTTYYPFHVDGRGFYDENGIPANACMNKRLVAEWSEPTKPDADGWIEWKGGECPVDPRDVVEIRLENGSKHRHIADIVDWLDTDGTFRTVAYRVTKPAKGLPVTIESGPPADKHAHYFHDVSQLDKIDVYRVIDMFKVTHPALAHAAKKILCAGGRGAKDQAQDVQEAIDSLVRWQAMQAEDSRA